MALIKIIQSPFHKKIKAALLVLVVVALTLNLAPFKVFPSAHGTTFQGQLHVSGNHLVDTSGNQVRLVGLNYGDLPVGAPDFHSGNPATDAGRISTAGFNAVNLNVEWARLETSGYTYDLQTTLIPDIKALTSPTLQPKPLYVIIKLHADSACRPNESSPCMTDYNNLISFLNVNNNGAGTQYCTHDPSRIIPNSNPPKTYGEGFSSSFSDAFYGSAASFNSGQGNGIDHLTKLWRAISRAIASDPTISALDHVVGYDLVNEPTTGPSTDPPPGCTHLTQDSIVANNWNARVNEIISDLRANGGSGGDNKVVSVELAPFFSHQTIQQSFVPFTDPKSNVIVSFHFYDGECNHNDSSSCPTPSVSGSWTACTADGSVLTNLWSSTRVTSIPDYCHPTNLYIAQLQAAYPNQAVSVGEFGNIYYQDVNSYNQPWNLNAIDVFNKNQAIGYFYWSYAACLSVSCSPNPCNNQNCGTWINDEAKTPVWPLVSCVSLNQLSTGSVTLSWSPASTLASGGITNYRISKDNVLLNTVSGSTLAYSDGTIVAGSTHQYQVQAQDALGNAVDASKYYTTNGPSISVTASGSTSDPNTDYSLIANSACPVFSGSAQGPIAPSILTLQGFGRFSDTVYLSASVTPSGPTVSLDTPSINLDMVYGPTITSVGLTALITPSLPAGTYTVTVSSQSRSFSHSASVRVIVTPDFVPYLNPTTVYLNPGTSVILGSTSLTSIGGYAGAVQVSAVPSDSRLTATLNSPTVTLVPGPAVQDSLTITASSSIPLVGFGVTFSASAPTKNVGITVQIVAPGGGGGGGSVLGGTFVTLANGTKTMVQNLAVGMQLRSYNMTTRQFVNTTITRFTTVTVNNYMVIMTTSYVPLITDQNPAQKVYVMFPNATWTLLPVTQLQVGYYLFQPETGTWARITYLYYHTGGSYTMYDIYNTDPHDYIANGYLDPWKT